MDKRMLLPVVLVAVMISGCIDPPESNEAPGCGFTLFGTGCYGKHIIKDFVVEPEFECLKIDVNNCNNGELEIVHNCTEDVTIGGLGIDPMEINEQGSYMYVYNYIDAYRTSTGELAVNFTQGVGDPYKPAFNDSITIDGKVGDREFQISYVKTKALC